MVQRYCLLVATFLFVANSIQAQVGSGALKGKVIDQQTGEPLPFVNLIIEENGNQVTGGATDFDGAYYIKPVKPGKYDVLVSNVGYTAKKVTGVVVNANKITFLDIQMIPGVEIDVVDVVGYKVPLIDKDGGSTGGTVTKEDIQRMPGRTANAIASTVAGVSSAGGLDGISVKGSRTDGTYYYIDGIKVRGSVNLPQSSIEEVQAITGGVPASYGDVTGGVISITTRGASRSFGGGLEYVTSGGKFGDDVYGLDNYGYNLLEGAVYGPLLWKKDEEGNKTDPLFGFFLSAQGTSILDPRPSGVDMYQITDEARDALIANPLTPAINAPSGTNYNSDFLRMSDVEQVKYRPNASQRGGSLAGRIDVNTTKTINLSFGGSLDFRERNDFAFSNSLVNAENNGLRTDFDWRIYGRFTQRFGSDEQDEESGSVIKNAYYSIMVDYSKEFTRFEDANHKDNLFNYGYVGRYRTFQQNSYTFDPDALGGAGAFIHDGFQDTLVQFTPDDVNAESAALTQQYFSLFDNVLGNYENFPQIQQGGGLLNGESPESIYNLWRNIGTQYNDYRVNDNNQYRITTSGSADIGNHAVSLGIEYEQRIDREYFVGARAGARGPVNLWTLGRQLTNFHISQLDFSDSTISNIGSANYITYSRLNVAGDQSTFDRNLRNALGLDPNGNDFIDFDAIDPSLLSVDFFSPDELLNNGSNYVQYYGYDHAGNKTRDNPSFNDFFTQRDENGNFVRPIAPFQPIYIAGYVMDKFSFDDIIFNVGLRVDRFDANQMVLKDRYLLRAARTAGEVSEFGEHPGNIGDDFVVYVNDINDPTAINGYRDGDTWYNADGEVVNDPTQISTGSGIAPYLAPGEVPISSQDPVKPNVFKDYEPQVNFMPRIAFSFPISDVALFFAHYDVLTQRPEERNRLNPIDYYFIQQQSDFLNNPDLRPRKTIDYALGFQQVLSKSSSLKIEAFYREIRDDIQLINVVGAYPANYSTWGNIDFSTVKGLSFSYDLRRTGNIWMRANYTLQFAEGTGSTATSGLNLINSGEPNLRQVTPLAWDQRHRFNFTVDYRYGRGENYNGPVWFGKQIFASSGVNFVSNLGSGTPYTSRTGLVEPQAVLVPGVMNVEGSINGSRLPWEFTTDLQVDRDIPITFGKGEDDKAKTSNLNVYVLFLNIFNNINVRDVYGYTGLPDDDGYLASAVAQPAINGQTDPQSFRELYQIKANDFANFGLPRQIRLGVRLDF